MEHGPPNTNFRTANCTAFANAGHQPTATPTMMNSKDSIGTVNN